MEVVITPLGIAVMILVVLALLALAFILRSPFDYPHYTHKFDVSGKRNPDIDDILDRLLISDGFREIEEHHAKVEEWKSESLRMVEKSPIKGWRMGQYKQALDDRHAYKFITTRLRTKYRQSNYNRTAYKVEIPESSFECDYDYIKDRYDKLAEIGFECTLKDYHSKNQRKLATRELREKIMRRDDYTCQICGKYMPDEVGLQVDHIIPIAKGGKTVESNLQILCSKCNSSKSSKILEP